MTTSTSISLQARDPLAVCCPYCREGLFEGSWSCTRCEVAYHEACVSEFASCATLGCSGSLEERRGPSCSANPPESQGGIGIGQALLLVTTVALPLLALVHGANLSFTSALGVLFLALWAFVVLFLSLWASE